MIFKLLIFMFLICWLCHKFLTFQKYRSEIFQVSFFIWIKNCQEAIWPSSDDGGKAGKPSSTSFFVSFKILSFSVFQTFLHKNLLCMYYVAVGGRQLLLKQSRIANWLNVSLIFCCPLHFHILSQNLLKYWMNPDEHWGKFGSNNYPF